MRDIPHSWDVGMLRKFTVARQSTLALVVALLGLFCLTTSVAYAQLGATKNIPNDGYFLGFAEFNNGNLRDAQEIFRSAGKAGYISVDGRWVDAICFHTMIGECFYQAGDLTQAMDQYNSALKLFCANSGWMTNVTFNEANITKNVSLRAISTWGNSQRNAIPGGFPDKSQMLIGNIDNSRQFQQGGVVAAPQFMQIYHSEIVRCTALAMSRRREILGPVCQHDLLTKQVLTASLSGIAPGNHWSTCWGDLQIGLAYSAAGKPTEAVSYLTKSMLAAGQYDHPLTCVSLLELGKLAFDAGKFDAAHNFFMEASYSAAMFERPAVVEEALRFAALTHIVLNRPGVHPALGNATTWARANRYRYMQVSLMTAAAEGMSTLGDGSGALATINLARGAAGRSDMLLGQVGARLNYETARAQFMTGNVALGNTALSAAMLFQKKCSRRLYQITLCDNLSAAGVLTDLISDRIYAITLREPTAADWLIEPMETLAVVSNPHPIPYEHWLSLALTRKEVDKAFNIADRIRRHRFFATLPLGGRILAIRWVLEAPKESLDEETLLQRQAIFAKYPQLSELADKSSKLQSDLAGMQVVGLDDADQKKQRDLLADLGTTAIAQEALLQQIALHRMGATFVFPPLRNTKTIQENLRPGQLVFVYLQTSKQVHAFALGRENIAYFQLNSLATVKKEVAEILRSIGHHDRNTPVPAVDFASTDWKTVAGKLLPLLTNGTKATEWNKYEELIVVPDGILWYLPFEILQVSLDSEVVSLGSLVKVRYAPTAGLAIADGRPKKRVQRTAIVPGKMLSRDDEAVGLEMSEQIQTAIPESEIWKQLPAQGGLASTLIDRLILLQDVEDSDKQPYAWSPLGLDRNKPGSQLADWLLMPWQGPEQIVLPGFHSAAENGLKKGGTGDDIFLTLCGLMSNGARSIMISRWRVGGESTRELTREFVQELPHMRATDAWQRSLKLWQKRGVDPVSEPRVKFAEGKEIPADHPFFWAGYMIVDSEMGEVKTVKEVVKPEEPIVEEPLPPVPAKGGKGDAKAGEKAGMKGPKGGKGKEKMIEKFDPVEEKAPDAPKVNQKEKGGDDVIGDLLPGKKKPKAKK